ncbi:MAG: D-2-hydroxyacid dehydrogenase, partial [Gammaproteobacteria bacterium]|nr:D-2-hydroxyacid dehydrogenase [Gammaproteobacteria bacterium]
LAEDWKNFPATSTEETLQRVRNAELIISNKVVLDRAILSQCKQLKLVCVIATGTDNVDLQAAKELGIAVTNVTAYGTPSVVQFVFALLLSLATRLNEHQASSRNGEWSNSPNFCVLDYQFRELSGKTLGIIGYGELGKGVAKVAQALGMHVLVSQRPGGEPSAGRVPIEELLSQSDVISLHVPLADNTRNLIGEVEFKLMKPTALLINAARGGIVDELALINALQSDEIAGAGVDVLSQEPPRNGNPLLDYDKPNLIVTPHMAWGAVESRQRLIDLVAENIIAYQNGEKRNRVE